MKIHFKMLINDGEKYYISDNPGIALCDYVYMRGLESIDDNRFWEEQLAHYQAHKAFNFDLDLVASSSIANISNAIAERIGFDKSKFAESYPRIYLLEDGEFVEIITPTVCLAFSVGESVIFLVISYDSPCSMMWEHLFTAWQDRKNFLRAEVRL